MSEQTIHSNTIFVQNFHPKDSTEDAEKQLIDYFTYCGTITKYAVGQQTDGSWCAYITFESPEGAKVARLLNTAEIRPGNEISVEYFPEVELESTTLIWTTVPSTEHISVQTQAYYSNVINALLQAGYNIKDNAIDTAKHYDCKFREALKTTGDVTTHTLHNIQEKNRGSYQTS